MEVRPVFFCKIDNLNFKSKYYRLGYDDEISTKTREIIRDHYNPIPYYDVLEGNGRLGEYELDKLIGSLVGKNVNMKNINTLLKTKTKGVVSETDKSKSLSKSKKKKTESKKDSTDMYIKKLGQELFNFTQIVGMKHSYRGSASNITDEILNNIANAGIKNVVVLTSTMVDENDAKKYGLNFVPFSPDDNIFENDAFTEKPNLKMANKMMSESSNIGHVFIPNTKVWNKNTHNFKKELVSFIKTMQQDNVYIGCDFGILKTDEALMLDYFFNPKANKTPDCITQYNKHYLLKIKNLYDNLESSDKKAMGWNKDFDEKFIPKLKKIIEQQGFI